MGEGRNFLQFQNLIFKCLDILISVILFNAGPPENHICDVGSLFKYLKYFYYERFQTSLVYLREKAKMTGRRRKNPGVNVPYRHRTRQ